MRDNCYLSAKSYLTITPPSAIHKHIISSSKNALFHLSHTAVQYSTTKMLGQEQVVERNYRVGVLKSFDT
jgi:hypothetical protein